MGNAMNVPGLSGKKRLSRRQRRESRANLAAGAFAIALLVGIVVTVIYDFG